MNFILLNKQRNFSFSIGPSSFVWPFIYSLLLFYSRIHSVSVWQMNIVVGSEINHFYELFSLILLLSIPQILLTHYLVIFTYRTVCEGLKRNELDSKEFLWKIFRANFLYLIDIHTKNFFQVHLIVYRHPVQIS